VKLLDELSSRLRFGMKPGLDAMRTACAALGNPERNLRGAIHVAGTNGKGAVCAMLDACLRAGGFRVGRYTSPHLINVNERFFLDGAPVDDCQLDAIVSTLKPPALTPQPLTYFELLTLVAFLLYAREDPDFTMLETGLGGRLDATNVCTPCLTVITRIGLDHCDWLGDTVEKIAVEKAGIVKPGVPIVLGRNLSSVRAVVEARAREVGAPFFYAPDMADESEIPSDFSLAGSFNRENAVTALAALKILAHHAYSLFPIPYSLCLRGFAQTGWPGRFQRVGGFIVDGAHNPPAARALAEALADVGFGEKSLNLICGFCGDKDVEDVLKILAPFVARAFAVQTNNPRSLTAAAMAEKLSVAGIPTTPCPSLAEAISLSASPQPSTLNPRPSTLICGSLFLAGEALVALGASPWGESGRFDAAEKLK